MKTFRADIRDRDGNDYETAIHHGDFANVNTAENFKSRIMRYAVNLTPVFRATGAWVTHIGADIRLVTLKLPLKLKTRNPMGTLCGGNMYSAVHGIYSAMLGKNLGEDYLCVDRMSVIKFLKPGKSTLFARFEIAQTEIDAIKAAVEKDGRTDRQYAVELKDASGMICAEVTCTVHIRKINPHQNPSAGVEIMRTHRPDTSDGDHS